jgi:hypothetical protein
MTGRYKIYFADGSTLLIDSDSESAARRQALQIQCAYLHREVQVVKVEKIT